MSIIKKTAFLTCCTLLTMWASTTHANKAHSILAGMAEPERRTFFGNYLKNSGEACDSVTKTFFQGLSKQGEAFWNVRCRNGRTYAVMINNDATGSTRILECEVLKVVGGGECFKKF